jgi:hypothetical protein
MFYIILYIVSIKLFNIFSNIIAVEKMPSGGITMVECGETISGGHIQIWGSETDKTLGATGTNTVRYFQGLLVGAAPFSGYSDPDPVSRLAVSQGPLDARPYTITVNVSGTDDNGNVEIIFIFEVVEVFNILISQKQWALKGSVNIKTVPDLKEQTVDFPATTRRSIICDTYAKIIEENKDHLSDPDV